MMKLSQGKDIKTKYFEPIVHDHKFNPFILPVTVWALTNTDAVENTGHENYYKRSIWKFKFTFLFFFTWLIRNLYQKLEIS